MSNMLKFHARLSRWVNIDFLYEKYTHQSLPEREYRKLLGSAICVFNSNNQFVIENILRNDYAERYIIPMF